MTETLIHRGPDDGGVWVDGKEGIALGNRRLAIMDLSPAGHQPMVSSCGRYVIVYNGECYNFAVLRQELMRAGRRFRSRTDTEVVLEGCAHWGARSMAERMNGMFAFGLWDRKARTLTLVRDRLGIKPLYYGWCGDTFLFGSELKALRAHPDFSNEVDRNSLALFLRHNCVPSPYTIYKGVFQLLPGHILTLGRDWQRTIVPFWSAKRVVEAGKAKSFEGSEAEAIEQLDALLHDAVHLRMIADVPLGVFLSGGVDSSTVAALMQVQSSQPVKTYTVGFFEEGYNEARDAKQVARHLGTDHTELYVTPKQTQAVIPQLSEMYDEPFSDSSQIPTFLISQLTRQYVTVSLSGDGGDELFGGYNRHLLGETGWGLIRRFPICLRKVAARGIRSFSQDQWDRIFQRVGRWLPARFQMRLPGEKMYKLAEVLRTGSPEEMYYNLVSHWKSPAHVVIGACEPQTKLTDETQAAKVSDFAERMMYLDLVTYLPDDILAKVDRASMAVSLEARVPLLDYRVVEFAWQLPLFWKIKDGQSKWLLRQVLYHYVPAELIERPKTGFSIPIDVWLKGPLRDWAEDLLDERRLKREGYFSPEPIRQKWNEHLSGRRNWQNLLWDVLMFQAWQERWLRQ